VVDQLTAVMMLYTYNYSHNHTESIQKCPVPTSLVTNICLRLLKFC